MWLVRLAEGLLVLSLVMLAAAGFYLVLWTCASSDKTEFNAPELPAKIKLLQHAQLQLVMGFGPPSLVHV